MDKNPYWTSKHWSRSNAEVIRTIASCIAVVINTVVLLRVFGWL